MIIRSWIYHLETDITGIMDMIPLSMLMQMLRCQ